MKILGIDPGTATTGYAILENESNINKILDFGLIETGKDIAKEKRLQTIYLQINKLIKIHKPQILAIERLFFASNAKTAMAVGQALGVMILCAGENNINVFEYAPASIKKEITGDGRADKKMIQKYIRLLLNSKSIRSKPNKKTHFDNAADAIAVALCHIIKTRGSL